ncbi:hypothetical protein WKV44_03730 [Spirochaetia bacterium 38H-sp]|uniref:Helicase XPB/Ssl2 N-terminal domain-containing protein n=1 Tax=Rarispira pelagica TaxID=3141764 RepID=A0ABU9UAG4_9SPIR
MDRRRDRAEWVDYLLGLPDKAFLNIIRNYLGRIETPYHKPRFIEKLEKYLSTAETQKAIEDLLSAEDRQVLSIIALSKKPAEKELTDFLSRDGIEDADIKIRQLYDRLLIFPDKEGRLLFTPALKNMLTEKAISVSYAFPPEEGTWPGNTPVTWCTPALISAFFSILIKDPTIITVKGEIKAKKQEEIAEKIADFTENPQRLIAITQALTKLDICTEKDKKTLLKKADNLSQISQSQRLSLFAAASIAEKEDIQKLAKAILLLNHILISGKNYTKRNINRAILFSLGELAEKYGDTIEETLILWGILHKKDTVYTITQAEVPSSAAPQMIIEQTGRINIYPHAKLEDILIPACTADLEKHDIVSHYTISKKSYKNIVEAGIEPGEIPLRLMVTSSAALPHSLSRTLELWQEEAERIRHIEGIIAILQPQYAQLVKKLPGYKHCIREELTENILLIKKDRAEEWQNLLSQAGIEIVLPTESDQEQKDTRLETDIEIPAINIKTEIPPCGNSKRKKELIQELEKKDIPQETKKNILAKIESGFILFSAQMTDANSVQDILEADGLDYQAKIRLIEESLKSGTEKLELEITSPTGTINIKTRPIKLTKENNKHLLLVKNPSGAHPLTIEVAKIKKVKRLPQTLS